MRVNLPRVMLAVVIIGVMVTVARADHVLTGYKVVTHADGSWEYVWIYSDTTQPAGDNPPATQPADGQPTSDDDSGPSGAAPMAGGGGRRVPPKHAKPSKPDKDQTDQAEKCLTKNFDAFGNEVGKPLNRNVTKDALQAGIDAMDNATILPDDQFDALMKDSPNYQGSITPATYIRREGEQGHIYIRQSNWSKESPVQQRHTLEHEAEHAIIDNSPKLSDHPSQPDGGQPSEETLVDQFARDHCG